MSTFVYSTQKDFDGPWLVSRDALNELNDVFERISSSFEHEAQMHIDNEIAQRLEGYSEEMRDELHETTRERVTQQLKLRKNVKLTLSNSKYLQGETINELLANPELQEEAPTGIEVDVTASHLNARLQLGSRYFNRANLDISASPETDNISREAFADLQAWAVKNQPPYWQRLWRSITPYHWFIWFIAIIFATSALPSISDNVEKYLDPIAVELLLDGISEDEVPSGIELLLQYQTKHLPEEVKASSPIWFLILLFGGLVVSIILSICPKIVIGIGQNKNKLSLWRIWTRFVGISIPSFVFGSFILPYIVNWLKNSF